MWVTLFNTSLLLNCVYQCPPPRLFHLTSLLYHDYFPPLPLGRGVRFINATPHITSLFPKNGRPPSPTPGRQVENTRVVGRWCFLGQPKNDWQRVWFCCLSLKKKHDNKIKFKGDELRKKTTCCWSDSQNNKHVNITACLAVASSLMACFNQPKRPIARAELGSTGGPLVAGGFVLHHFGCFKTNIGALVKWRLLMRSY